MFQCSHNSMNYWHQYHLLSHHPNCCRICCCWLCCSVLFSHLPPNWIKTTTTFSSDSHGMIHVLLAIWMVSHVVWCISSMHPGSLQQASPRLSASNEQVIGNIIIGKGLASANRVASMPFKPSHPWMKKKRGVAVFCQLKQKVKSICQSKKQKSQGRSSHKRWDADFKQEERVWHQ